MAAEDPQMIKKVAAASYDYENDSRWPDYWSNVLIPPHLQSRPEVMTHYKKKFYQRYIDPELEVESLSAATSVRSTRSTPAPTATQNQTPSAGQTQAPGRSAGASQRTSSGSSQRTNVPASSLRLDQNSIQFLANASVLIMAALAIIPFTPPSLSDRAYRVALLGTWFSCAYSIYSQYGKPRAWNLQAVQVWLQSLVACRDFVYFLYCVVFVASPMPIKFSLISVLCRSMEIVAKLLRRNFSSASIYRKYLEDPCLWVEANTTTLNILSSNCEIMLGFLIVILLATRQRNIVQLFMYWQLLKLMYRTPTTAPYHHTVWTRLGMHANPFINRYAPFLRTPVSFLQRFFHQ